jgi:hypothetical protein
MSIMTLPYVGNYSAVNTASHLSLESSNERMITNDESKINGEQWTQHASQQLAPEEPSKQKQIRFITSTLLILDNILQCANMIITQWININI